MAANKNLEQLKTGLASELKNDDVMPIPQAGNNSTHRDALADAIATQVATNLGKGRNNVLVDSDAIINNIKNELKNEQNSIEGLIGAVERKTIEQNKTLGEQYPDYGTFIDGIINKVTKDAKVVYKVIRKADRGVTATTKFRGLKGIEEALVSSEASTRALKAKRDEAATKIQSVFRGFKARKNIEARVEKRKAAGVIQKAARGFLARKAAEKERLAKAEGEFYNLLGGARGLEYQLGKAKNDKDVAAAIVGATKLVDAIKKDFSKKNIQHDRIKARISDLESINLETIKSHVREAYLKKLVEKGKSLDNLTIRDIKSIDKEVEKLAQKELQKVKDEIKNVEDKTLLPKIRRSMGIAHKSLEDSHKELVVLSNQLKGLEAKQTALVGVRADIKREIKETEEQYGFKGVSGWFKKQATKVFGDEDDKNAINNLKILYDQKEKTKQTLDNTAKLFDESTKSYIGAKRDFEKVAKKAESKLEASKKFDKYKSALEKSELSTKLEEHKKSRQEVGAKRGENIARIAERLTSIDSRLASPTPRSTKPQSKGRGI